jgi:hypothetical protein
VIRSPVWLWFALSLAPLAIGCGEDDPKLKVYDLSPTSGSTEGGDYIIIKGNRFTKDGPRNAKIYFGSHQAQFISWQSDSQLIVQSPPGKAGDVVDVMIIFDPGGRLTIKKIFKYVEKNDSMGSFDTIKK